MDNGRLISLTADIVASHVANNNVAVGDVGNLVERVYSALSGLGSSEQEPQVQEKTPVVSVRASVKRDFIVCMECGNKQKTLRRHLMTAHGMSPDQYRQDYGLADTYPMVAPAYSEQRSSMAVASGFGRNKVDAEPEAAAPPAQETEAKPRRRKLKVKTG